MKKKLLIELLQLLEYESLLDEIKELSEEQNMKGYEILLKLTDKQIENILNQLDDGMAYALIYIYTNSERIPEKVQNLLDEEIEKKNTNLPAIIDMLKFNKLMVREDAHEFFKVALNTDKVKLEDVVTACTCRKLLNRKDAIEFVRKLSGAKEIFQSNYAVSVITDKNVIKKENAMEYVDAVINAYNELQAQYVSEMACNFEALKLKSSLEIVKFLASLQEDYKVENAYKVANYLISSDNKVQGRMKDKALEFAKKVAEAKSVFNAIHATDLVLNGNVFVRKDAIKFVDLVVNAEESYQTYNASLSAQARYLLLREDALDIVKAVSMAKGKVQAKDAWRTAVNYDILTNENVLEIVKSIASAKGSYQSTYAHNVAKDKGIINRKDASDIVKAVATSKRCINAEYAYEVAKNVLLQNIHKYAEHVSLLEIIKVIANTEKDYQIECASNVAKLPCVLKREDYLELITAVANSLGEAQAYTAMCELQKGNNYISLEDILKITNNPSYPKIKCPKGMSLKDTLSLISTSLKNDENCISQNINVLLSDGNIYKIIAMLSNSDNEEIENNITIKVKVYE